MDSLGTSGSYALEKRLPLVCILQGPQELRTVRVVIKSVSGLSFFEPGLVVRA